MEVKYIRNTLSGADAVAYRDFIATARGAHYLQAPNWAPVAAQPGVAQRYLLVHERGRVIGAARLLRRLHGVLRSPAAIIERGPVVNDANDLNRVLPVMMNAIRWHGIDKLRIQPYFAGIDAHVAQAAASLHGFTASPELDGPHTSTLRLQLGGVARDQLFAGRQHSDLRREARKATAAGLVVRRGTAADLPAFARLYQTMMEAQGDNDRASEYFLSFASLLSANVAALFVGENAGELDSVMLVIRQPGQTTFHLGASSATYRSYKKALLPLTHAIEWAHELGDTCFDLGGVPGTHDTDAKRQNIAKFKFHFARELVALAPVMHSPTTRAGRLLDKVRASVSKARSLTTYGLVALCSYVAQLAEFAEVAFAW